MTRNQRYRLLALAIGLPVFCVGLTSAASESPTPTPTPTPRPQGGKSLSEVAKGKELNKDVAGKSIVITNENLADYAKKGGVTAAETPPPNARRRAVQQNNVLGEPAKVSITPLGRAETRAQERREYWRGMYERQLQLVAAIENQIALLDREIPGLWRDFYAWDDPAFRDGVIKPRLDAALAKRERLEGDLKVAQDRLVEIKTDARKDGAEPGWFRGIKVPTPVPEPESQQTGIVY